MSKAAPEKTTITRMGRKYLVIHATVARVGNRNVVVQLLKRANKAHFFVTEGKASPTGKMSFWAALEAYSKRQDELGINPTDALPHSELEGIVEGLNDDEKAQLANRLEGLQGVRPSIVVQDDVEGSNDA